LAEALASMKKHESVLRQVGAIEALIKVAGGNIAVAALDAAFEKYLRDTKSIKVPLIADAGAYRELSAGG